MNTIKGVLLLVLALVALVVGAAVGGAQIAMSMHYVGFEISWFAASLGVCAALALNAIVKAVTK